MPKDLPLASNFYESNRFELSRLKSRARAGRYVESHAARPITFEFERRIHFEKMKVTSHLNWAISPVTHVQLYCSSSVIRRDAQRLQKIFARNHNRIGS